MVPVIILPTSGFQGQKKSSKTEKKGPKKKKKKKQYILHVYMIVRD